MITRDPVAGLTSELGAYVLFVSLSRPLAPAMPRRPESRLAPGCYAYCGSAWGPGGLRARIGRHLRRDKAPRWHVDRLTAAGRVLDVLAVPGGRECDLRARLERLEGVTLPLPGFGSSDCRNCRSHLLELPQGFDLQRLWPSICGNAAAQHFSLES